jgi:hypothetical protein
MEDQYRGRFNKSAPKPVPYSKHRIVEYNARTNVVSCTCEFEGTAKEFENHNTGKRKRSVGG